MVHALCPPSKRIATLDVLRGLVLLGLLIAQAFGPLAFPQPGHSLLEHHPAELPAQFILQLLVSGQFEQMGSFLFGIGLYQCWQYAGLEGPRRSASTGGAGAVDAPGVDAPGLGSTSLAGLDANRRVRRLLIGLLGIGFVLSLLLRRVDWLFQCALLGITLFYFRAQSVASLLYWIIGLCLLAIGIPSWLGGLHPAGVIPHSLSSWSFVPEWLLANRPLSQGFSATISYELLMLGGLLVGRLGLSHQDARLRVRLSLLQVVILPTAFLLKGAWVVLTLSLIILPENLTSYQPLLLAISGFFGPLLLTGVYVLDVGVNARLTPRGWTRWVGRVGRLSVSNYVLQSMLYPLLLYGFGVVVPGPTPFWGRAGIVVEIYAFQLALSKLWLNHYGHGPLERMCRQWIYGKRRPSNAVPTASH